jgi:DNA-binding transcriptional LysR family regulator
VDHSTFSAASKHRCITQPAFSRRIRLLEESLNTKLFDRNTQPVQLTSSGKVFLAHAQNLKKASMLASQDIQNHLSAMDNPINIATTHTLAVAFLPKLLKLLTPKGDIPFKLNVQSIGQCLEGLSNKKSDLALIHTHKDMAQNNQIDFCKIGEDELVTVQAPSCQTPEKLLAYTKDTGLSHCLEHSSEFLKHIDNITFESRSGEVLKALCLAGHGTSIIPKSLIVKEIRNNDLIISHKIKVNIKLNIEMARLKNIDHQERQEKIWKKTQKHEIMHT